MTKTQLFNADFLDPVDRILNAVGIGKRFISLNSVPIG